MHRTWVARAAQTLKDEQQREIDTPLFSLDLPEFPGIQIVLKDETVHPSGSLKHRLARSLFLHAICNGEIRQDKIVVEASSGSTAISEAYFASLLKLPLIAVVPMSTAPAKLEAIARAGAKVHLAQAHENVCSVALKLALEADGHYMDQFTFAERATDWRGNNNIAESLFGQLSKAGHPAPVWIVVGAGTGGTSATIGRYIRYRSELAATRLCVVDPEGSAFFPYFCSADRSATGTLGGIVEGIGRACVEPSFMRNVIDEMISIPDEASIAGVLWLERRTSRRFGPSTGTNIVGALTLASELAAHGQRGTIATLACDSGERYADTIYDPAWLAGRGIDIRSWTAHFAALAPEASDFGRGLKRARRETEAIAKV